MDFSNRMTTGETISSIDYVTSEKRGGELTDLVITNEAISGQTVEFWIAGGSACNSYRVEVKITTNLGQILEGNGLMRVED